MKKALPLAVMSTALLFSSCIDIKISHQFNKNAEYIGVLDESFSLPNSDEKVGVVKVDGNEMENLTFSTWQSFTFDEGKTCLEINGDLSDTLVNRSGQVHITGNLLEDIYFDSKYINQPPYTKGTPALIVDGYVDKSVEIKGLPEGTKVEVRGYYAPKYQ